MKRRFTFIKIIAVFLLVAVAIFAWRQWSRHKLHAAVVDETRRQLRSEGFKTELSDFELKPAPELLRRADSVGVAATAVRSIRAFDELRLMQPVGPHIARSSMRLRFIPAGGAPSNGAQLAVFLRRYSEEGQAASLAQSPLPDNLWDLLDAELQSSHECLREAARAIAEGPFGFEVVHTNGMLQQQYFPDIHRLASALSAQATLAIHENRQNDAYTNLLTLTQLITHWRSPPLETFYQTRFACVERAFRSFWEALQTDAWSDAQLERLQSEWERAELLTGLAESPALERAQFVRLCRNLRNRSFASQFGGWGQLYRQTISSFQFSATNGFRTLKQLGSLYQKFSNYREVGSFEDETKLLLCYRDLEIEFKRALALPAWEQMRPAVRTTQGIKFKAGSQSPINFMVNSSMMSFNLADTEHHLIARAATSETRRRLLITAIAIKRFRQRRGHNPETLSELVPDLLQSVPLDFMDGKPLRYRLFEDGRFLLYSTGLDCTDNGGGVKANLESNSKQEPTSNSARLQSWVTIDLVWPMVATENEIFAYEIITEKALRRMNKNLLEQIEDDYMSPRQREILRSLPSEFE